MHRKMVLVISTSTAMSFASLSAAAENEETAKVPETQAIVVTATRGSEIEQTGRDIVVVDRHTIELQMPESTSQLLQNEPNVTTTANQVYQGGVGVRGQDVNIRGLGGDRVVQVIDGVRQNFGSGHRSRYFLDPELIERIEVIKGPASSLWGGGAIGGAVVQSTKSAQDLLTGKRDIGGYLSQGYHSNNEKWITSGAVYGAHGRGDWLLNAYGNGSNDYRLGNGERLESSGADQRGGMLKGGFQYSDAHRFELMARIAENQENIPSSHAKSGVDTDGRDANINFGYQYHPSELLNLNTKIYANDTNYREVDRERSRDDSVQYRTYGVSLNSVSEFSKVSLLTGFDYYQDRIHTQWDDHAAPGTRPDNVDASANTLGLFVQIEVPLASQWTLIPGVRYDYFQLDDDRKPAKVVASKHNTNKLSPSIALIWQPVDTLTLSARYDEAFRAPTLEDLFSTGVHFCTPVFCNRFVPNPNLKPEEAANVEATAEWTTEGPFDGDAWDFSLTYFHNKVDNFIETRPVFRPQAAETYTFNLDRATIQGGELKAKYTHRNFGVDLGYGITRGENDKTDEPLRDMPADSVNLGVSYVVLDVLTLGTQYRYTRGQNKLTDKEVGQSYLGYQLWNFYASYEPTGAWDGFKATLRVDNAFDEYYRMAWQQLYMPGRNIKLNLRYLF